MENCSRINPVNAVAFYYTNDNVDNPHLAISCKENVILLVDNKRPTNWEYMDIVKDNQHEKKINSIAFSKKKFENSSIMATASADNTVKLWEQKHNGLYGNFLKNTLKHSAPVNSVAFHPSPSNISNNSDKSPVLILASGCQDNTAKLWKLTVTLDIVFIW